MQRECASPLSVSDLLCTRGWAVFDLDNLELTDEESKAARDWEAVFDTAFNQCQAEKESAGVYRVEQGVSVGYRVDSEREFFETRLTSSSSPEPTFPGVKDYATTARCLYSVFSKIGTCCIVDIGKKIGLDPQCLVDLTDLDYGGILPESPPSKTNPDFGKKDLVPTLSSSLLRICKYKSEECGDTTDAPSFALDSASKQERNQEHEDSPATAVPAAAATASPVWFGAHTDSSFLTISLCSTTPGLEIVDQESNSWVCPEKLNFLSKNSPTAPGASVSPPEHNASKRYAIVFVGEFLQVLTKNRFKAAVHRVKNFSADKARLVQNSKNPDAQKTPPPLSSVFPTFQTLSSSSDSASTRISCPFIVRGRNSAIIDIHNIERYNHPGGAAALSEDKVPNLDGTNMHLMHKLLDLKRQKCFRENGSAEGASWVLSAYPVPPLPAE